MSKENQYLKYLVENYYQNIKNDRDLKSLSKDELMTKFVKVGDMLKFDSRKGINLKIGEDFAMCCVEPSKSSVNRPLFISIKKFPVTTRSMSIFGGCGVHNKMRCFEEKKYSFINDLDGMNHLNEMIEITNDSYKNHDVYYNAAMEAYEYSPLDTETYGEWWIPSMGEWVNIIKGMNRTLFEELADDDYPYLSSTQMNEDMCYMFSIKKNPKGKPYLLKSKNDEGLLRLMIDPFKN